MIPIATKRQTVTAVTVTFTVPSDVAVSAVAEHVENAISEQGGRLNSLSIYPPQR